ncbi:MAG: pyridoxal-phosphate dependent enzyme [Candidatus Hydrogenedentes bacterium]|nr:pyridoxal-phosphate dependent enzyme [Candidatus Hydrogenedentota bacterium]
MQELCDRFEFACYTCGRTAPIDGPARCPACASPLALRPRVYLRPGYLERPARGLWDFRELLPLPRDHAAVSLGEGATPLVGATALAAAIGAGEIGLKNEMANPAGSFKDRQVAVGLNWARSKGIQTVAAVSSGNVAAAAAAYAARAGMRAVLFMHGQAAPAKMAQARCYGATVIAVEDPSPAAVFQLCIGACQRYGWYHLSTAGIYEPWNVEGAKTIAYELYQQYRGDLPDWIVAPVGGGGLLGGIWRGLLDLRAMGLVRELPRLAGVQAAGCQPLVQAIDAGWDFNTHLAHPWPHPDTIAGAIADDILFDGHTALPAIRETGGAAIAVTDAAMGAAQTQLAQTEGLFCEIASASAIAAPGALPGLDKNTRVCCIVSGSGLKELGGLAASADDVPRIPATPEALASVPGLPIPA